MFIIASGDGITLSPESPPSFFGIGSSLGDSLKCTSTGAWCCGAGRACSCLNRTAVLIGPWYINGRASLPLSALGSALYGAPQAKGVIQMKTKTEHNIIAIRFYFGRTRFRVRQTPDRFV
uniref:Uncharacterized protein n=1 Tax=Cacopsylla melanoneura TaxID=428564 RepID=A0A8D8XKC2_9HEMI